jgi:hypothetical protein
MGSGLGRVYCSRFNTFSPPPLTFFPKTLFRLSDLDYSSIILELEVKKKRADSIRFTFYEFPVT